MFQVLRTPSNKKWNCSVVTNQINAAHSTLRRKQSTATDKMNFVSYRGDEF
jgi:hypothetical protein